MAGSSLEKHPGGRPKGAVTKRASRQALLGVEHRDKIRTSKIFNQLLSYAEGDIDLEPGRVHVMLKLIDKILPSLSATSIDISAEFKGELEVNDARASVDEFLSRITSIVARNGTGEDARQDN